MSKVLFVISPTISAIGNSKMGSTGNKLDCAGHHFVNAAKYNVAMAATLGAAGAVGYARAAANGALTGGALKNIATIYKAVPAPIKALAGIATATFLALKHYHIGRIEQTYMDKAQFVGDVDRNNGIAK